MEDDGKLTGAVDASWVGGVTALDCCLCQPHMFTLCRPPVPLERATGGAAGPENSSQYPA